MLVDKEPLVLLELDLLLFILLLPPVSLQVGLELHLGRCGFQDRRQVTRGIGSVGRRRRLRKTRGGFPTRSFQNRNMCEPVFEAFEVNSRNFVNNVFFESQTSLILKDHITVIIFGVLAHEFVWLRIWKERSWLLFLKSSSADISYRIRLISLEMKISGPGVLCLVVVVLFLLIRIRVGLVVNLRVIPSTLCIALILWL